MKDAKITVLDTMRKGNWYFRVSTLESFESDAYSIMVVIWNRRYRDNLYFRFFADDELAAAFVDECASGKYGDILEDGL